MSIEDEVVLLNSAITQLMRKIRQIDETQGVGRARLSALAVLHFGGECSLSELAERELVSRATMHHVVKGLEGDGCVRIVKDKHDARKGLIKLTARGRSVIKKAHRARIDYLLELSSTVGNKELSVTARTLDALRVHAYES